MCASALQSSLGSSWEPPPLCGLISEPGYCPVRLGMTTGRLQSGVNTLQGFKEDKRNKVTPGTAPTALKCLLFQGARLHVLFYSLTLGGIFATLAILLTLEETEKLGISIQNEFHSFFSHSPLCCDFTNMGGGGWLP